jgi:hypothetical protein
MRSTHLPRMFHARSTGHFAVDLMLFSLQEKGRDPRIHAELNRSTHVPRTWIASRNGKTGRGTLLGSCPFPASPTVPRARTRSEEEIQPHG